MIIDQTQHNLRIFVSHSSKDDDFGRKIAHDLRSIIENQNAVWYDKAGGLYGGEEWWSKIIHEVTTREVFIIVLSPAAMDSDWVRTELDIALNERRRVIPLLYRQCEIRADLKTRQIISPNTYQHAFNDLLRALGLLKASPFTPPRPKATRIKPEKLALLRTLGGHTGSANSISFSPDGKLCTGVERFSVLTSF